MGLNCCQNESPEAITSKKLDRKIKEWMKEHNAIKLLLLGPGESGKTTIIKQMKIIHMKGFPDEERNNNIKEVRRNVLEAIKELTANMAFLVPPIQLGNTENLDSFEFINNASMMYEYKYTQEFFNHVSRLWQDNGVIECFKRSAEFQLIDSAKYFLDRVERISKDDYIPTDEDILHCRKRTSDIQKIEFGAKIKKIVSDKVQRFCMYDVGGQRGERRKWIQVFDGITAILFVVACSGFNCRIREDNETNRLKEAMNVFEEVWFSRFLRSSGFILFLNKQDILKEKVREGAQIVHYFPEYENYQHTPEAEEDPNDEYLKVRTFIRDKFSEITTKEKPEKRYSAADIYYDGKTPQKQRAFFWHYTTATDTNNIKTVFDDVHFMMIMWNLDKIHPI